MFYKHMSCYDKTFPNGIIALTFEGAAVVKLLACVARGPGIEPRSRLYDFRNWIYSTYKL